MLSAKYVIWDWNGTLLDDVGLCVDCMNLLLSRYGIRNLADRQEYRAKFCFPVEEYYRRAGFDFEKADFASLAGEYIALYQPRSVACGLTRGASGALESLRGLGCRQIILSASKQEYLEEQVAHRGIEGYFERLLGMGDVLARSKVDSAKSWIGGSGLDPSELVLVGDTLHDYEVSRELGCRCVIFAEGHQTIDASLVGDSAIIDDLRELVALV
jgi:phosphoglycolate phosphatase